MCLMWSITFVTTLPYLSYTEPEWSGKNGQERSHNNKSPKKCDAFLWLGE